MIWCPHCHYPTVLNRFPSWGCPQCRRAVPSGDELRENPCKPDERARTGTRGGKRKRKAEDEE